jgi:MYXO-CTERM domain-containing protein
MTLRRFAVLPAVLALCNVTPAHAGPVPGYVQATAAEGSYPAVQVQNPGNLAQAVSPDNQPGGGAAATATRLRVEASSDGTGAGPTGQYFHAASAANWSEYVLWDFSAGQALPADEARRLNVSFNFRLLSRLSLLDHAGLDVGTMGYAAEVVSLNSALVNRRADAVSYAVGSPDSFTGNLSLLGLVDLSFSLLHDDSSSGWLSMEYGNSGANDVTAAGALWLQSITVTEDPPLPLSQARSAHRFVEASTVGLQTGRVLGVRFDSGAMYAFGQDLDASTHPVPEPASGVLALLALVALTRHRHRLSRG